MKFYVIEISTGAASISGKAIYEYASEHEAVATFHQKLGTAMKSDLYESELLIVVDADGKVVKREKYVR